MSAPTLIVFLAVVLTVLWASHRAARKAHRSAGLASRTLSPLSNALAMSGEYMSVASLLGISGLVFAGGFDGLLYAVGFLAGWPVVLFLLAEPLRNLGRFGFADVLSYRLEATRVRTAADAASVAVVVFYLVPQLVAAGKLTQMLLGVPYTAGVVGVGLPMVLYAALGGRAVATRVQIFKAVLLLAGSSFMVLAALSRVDYSTEALFRQATQVHALGEAIMAPGLLIPAPLDVVSLGIALVFGTAGLPHILARFFTVADAPATRRSAFYATVVLAYFYALTFAIGFAAVVLVTGDPAFLGADGGLVGGHDMAALYLARVVGGELFLGIVAAVTFATILAVVSGLTLAGAAALSPHVHGGARGLPAGLAGGLIGAMAIPLALAFHGHDVAYLVGLAFAVAASANFPTLLLAVTWRGLTTRGALAGTLMGLVSTLALTLLGPAVWVDVLGRPEPVFPSRYPALYSVTLAFVAAWLASLTDHGPRAEAERGAFDEQHLRSQGGPGQADGIRRP